MRNDELHNQLNDLRRDIYRLKRVIMELKHKVDVLESRQLPVEPRPVEPKEDYDYE